MFNKFFNKKESLTAKDNIQEQIDYLFYPYNDEQEIIDSFAVPFKYLATSVIHLLKGLQKTGALIISMLIDPDNNDKIEEHTNHLMNYFYACLINIANALLAVFSFFLRGIATIANRGYNDPIDLNNLYSTLNDTFNDTFYMYQRS